MSKKDNIRKLTKFLALSLAHKIGSMTNLRDPYAGKYEKEGDAYFVRANKVSFSENWNNYDKVEIKIELKKKLKAELERKDFLDNRKFDFMDEEINKALLSLDLLPS